ncbi:uncharacterized protein [Narcine bancroftii]|uniref:uncharacterized protein isoform X2 n=1 Tax=Narcine bancroftii TaxID=1343680 RepID=UPI0038310E03
MATKKEKSKATGRGEEERTSEEEGEGITCPRRPAHSEPEGLITVSDLEKCNRTEVQICLIMKVFGGNIAFRVVASGYGLERIAWFKLCFSRTNFSQVYRLQTSSYRRRLTPPAELLPRILLKNQNLAMELLNVSEDDFYPNRFWVEFESAVETYDDIPFELLNLTRICYYFILDNPPIGATCINTHGSYKCQCEMGYSGDGISSCIDLDECLLQQHTYSPNAFCINTLGSFLCVCQRGHFGDGFHCIASSIWTPWSICTATCGVQNKMRIRMCTHPESGMRCDGPSWSVRCSGLAQLMGSGQSGRYALPPPLVSRDSFVSVTTLFQSMGAHPAAVVWSRPCHVEPLTVQSLGFGQLGHHAQSAVA